MNTNARDSNVELLRIISTLGVIILHINSGGGGFAYVSDLVPNFHIMLFIELFFICAVNVFILIFGYFNYEKDNARLSKPLSLLFQLIVYSEGRYLINCVLKKESVTVSRFLYKLIPMNWYISLYVVLFLLAPYINRLLKTISRHSFEVLLGIMLLMFSVWPTFLDLLSERFNTSLSSMHTIGTNGSGQGYTIINFVLLYIIGVYIRKYRIHFKRPFLCYLMCVFALFFYSRLSFSGALSYCNPITVLQTVCIFLAFKKTSISSVPINHLAKGSFSVYLLHTFFLPYIDIQINVSNGIGRMLCFYFVSSVIIYLFGFAIGAVYSYLVGNSISKIPKKPFSIIISAE